MRIKSMSTRKKLQRDKQWHPWFAWYPVRINDDELTWLEIVDRRLDFLVPWCTNWEYRERSSK